MQDVRMQHRETHAVGRLTLTKDSGETGLRWPDAASEGAFLTAGAGWRWSREKTCTVPLSEDRASHCGLSPLLNAMLYMHAGSAPLRSSCTFGARRSCQPGSLIMDPMDSLTVIAWLRLHGCIGPG